MKKIILALIVMLMLTACGDRTIDGSTEKTYRESMQELTDNLPREKSTGFQSAIKTIMFAETIKSDSDDRTQIKNLMINIIDGKTADEVIELGKISTLVVEKKMKEITRIKAERASNANKAILKAKEKIGKQDKKQMCSTMKNTLSIMEKSLKLMQSNAKIGGRAPNSKQLKEISEYKYKIFKYKITTMERCR